MPRKNTIASDSVKKPTKVTRKKVAHTSQALAEAEKPTQRGRKRKTVIDLQQTDGKLYNKHGVRSIDELLGIKTSKYNTHDIKVYQQQIEHMNTSDLQKHCTEVDVMPNQERAIMMKRLLAKFNVTNSAYLNTAQITTGFPKPISQEVLDILAGNN